MRILFLTAALFISTAHKGAYHYNDNDTLTLKNRNLYSTGYNLPNPSRSIPKHNPNRQGDTAMSSVNLPIPLTSVLQYKALALKWSKQTNIPAALILAVIDQESGGNATARRYEKAYNPSPRHAQAMTKANIPLSVQKTSYGLMQMMFPVAWGYGARSTIELEYPDKAIRYGAAHLAALASHQGKHGWMNDAHIKAIAGAYNGAGPNSKYARDVLTLYNKYSKEV